MLGFASAGRDVQCPEAEFLDEIQTKVLRVFLLLFTVTSADLP